MWNHQGNLLFACVMRAWFALPMCKPCTCMSLHNIMDTQFQIDIYNTKYSVLKHIKHCSLYQEPYRVSISLNYIDCSEPVIVWMTGRSGKKHIFIQHAILKFKMLCSSKLLRDAIPYTIAYTCKVLLIFSCLCSLRSKALEDSLCEEFIGKIVLSTLVSYFHIPRILHVYHVLI